ncbi:PREDICTED: pleckstrin homology domain-containing family F member 2-like isoform X2 [Amphimedon queenslandica]|uniref:Pleckstrin homology domain-containing family F member 2 n=1 Tax=Amphimedon queenslandica TaxID=400682 RepID=A0AAN0K4S3_AMPQE|nr:PREDICTED: pleckstrin homology domain-containing family F member 2-like isoform X2 [Amphimedon queenslandica]|eukprot:XP_019864174.1 PREDICTED: pleckstrin homology domain-containing family F member 2-like isoform X2 [Amphimedon queenslandica]
MESLKRMHSEANHRRIAIVEQCFGSNGQSLTKTGRVLVGEGVLTKMCRKKAKPRQFFLFNDILVYGNIVIDKRKYNKQHIVPLEDVKIQSLENDGPWKNGWQVISPKKSFAVYAASPTEKSEWMAHINKCIADLLANSNKRPATEHAAVWVPDSEAQTCMHCLKVKFTPIQRRHHCRKCGAVVCGGCSNKKFILSYQSDKPVRVCITCYEVLSNSVPDKDKSSMIRPDYESASASVWNSDEQLNDDDTASGGSADGGVSARGGMGTSDPIITPQPRYGSSDEEEDDIELPPGSLPESHPQFYDFGTTEVLIS